MLSQLLLVHSHVLVPCLDGLITCSNILVFSLQLILYIGKHWETAAKIFGSNVEICGVVCIDDTIVPEKIRHYITTLVFCNW